MRHGKAAPRGFMSYLETSARRTGPVTAEKSGRSWLAPICSNWPGFGGWSLANPNSRTSAAICRNEDRSGTFQCRLMQ
jgi:hypothetical protein